MSRIKRLPPWLLLSILTLSILQHFTHTTRKPATEDGSTTPKTQWQITQVQRWQLNLNQSEQTYLQARSATQTEQQGQQHLTFTQPQIVIISSDKASYIESQKGELFKTQQQQILTLEGAVKMHNQPSNPTTNTPVQTLTTDLATFDLTKQLLQAPGFVKITQPNIEITGIGLTAQLKQEQYQLKSSVTTRYQKEPHTTP